MPLLLGDSIRIQFLCHPIRLSLHLILRTRWCFDFLIINDQALLSLRTMSSDGYFGFCIFCI